LLLLLRKDRSEDCLRKHLRRLSPESTVRPVPRDRPHRFLIPAVMGPRSRVGSCQRMGMERRAMGGRTTQFAIALVALAVGLLAAPAAQGARSEFYGIAQNSPDGNDILGMAGAKVRTDRYPFVWNQIEPSKGSFTWHATDQLVGTLAVFGIRTAPFVWGAPGWAGTGGLQ